VEGYKWEPMPKLEVHRPEVGQPALYPDDPHIVAVASSVAAPGDLPAATAWLDLDRPDQVLAWLRQRYFAQQP
jgi:molybdopterin-guanine dinucleotide biosynthesis protein B